MRNRTVRANKKLRKKVETMRRVLGLIANMTGEWPTERLAIAGLSGRIENVISENDEYLSGNPALRDLGIRGEEAWDRDLPPKRAA